ncbi:claudin-18 [Chanos chanos]|uniref:Claudin n=1 Tax=Chanos chanos TaxID=29144 RepID=A0A6J2VCM8_CHACN|nr:claudin-18-like [Chanos chanos]
MASTVLQTFGFVLGLIGVAALIAGTAMNNWSTKDRQGDVVTSVYTYKGLWMNCEVSTAGFTECRPLYGLLGYAGSFQAVRALMIVGIILGVIAAGISLFSLKCFRVGRTDDSVKAKMTLAAGVMFLIGGVCGIAGASIYASQIVASFMLSTYNPNYGEMSAMEGMGANAMGGMGMGGMGSLTPRYTFGPALFVVWIGGALLVIGAILKCIAFKAMQPKGPYKSVAYKAQSQTTAAYEDSESGKRNKNYV